MMDPTDEPASVLLARLQATGINRAGHTGAHPQRVMTLPMIS